MNWEGKREYFLREGVRARREAFGLLFYNSGDTRLTFVKSGSLLDIERDSTGARRLSLSCNNDQCDDKGRIERLIETLLRKGLIVETRATI